MPNADVKEQDTLAKAARRNLSVKRVLRLAGRGARSVFTEGFEATYRKIAFRVCLMQKKEVWPYKSDRPTQKQLRRERRAALEKAPLISILVPLYNTPERYLREMISSCLAQSYQNFELCLADASDTDAVEKVVAAYRDKRICYKKLAENAGISGNTNAAIALSSGAYLGLLDHDDLLRPDALYEMVKAINETGADFLYSDEIVLSDDLSRLKGFHFKPDFSPDSLRGCNYITHFSLFSRALGEEAGLYEDSRYDGAQDHDLILRLTEKARLVHHVPKVLYTWRAHSGSTAGTAQAKPYAALAGARAVAAQLERLHLAGRVEALPGPGSYRVRYETCEETLISVIIPTKDHPQDLARCLKSLYKNAGHLNFEVLLIENGSREEATFAYYEKAKASFKNLRVVLYEGAFNFSALCNLGAREAAGSQLLLLNNDIEVTSENFLTELLMFSQRADVGAVGAKLLYPDGTIQHGGVFIGLGGSAGHSHKGHPGTSGGDMYRLATAQNLSAVTGACLMVKKELYDALSGLDEEHFAVAFNDVDFCLRLREAGYLNVFTPFAAAVHYESRTRGYEEGSAREERFLREREYFRQKYAALLAAGDPYYNPHLTLEFENYAIG